MGPLELASTNLTSPAVLAFALGVTSSFLRSDLKLPEAVHATLTTYLLLAIGLKGGGELASASPGSIIVPALVALALGSAIPVWTYAITRRLKFGVADSAALAAHYGSVSVVTFTATLTFLDAVNVTAEGFMAGLVALMEIPAIIVALAIASSRTGGRPMGHAMREVLGGRGILLLAGGLAIGAAAGDDGLERVKPFFIDPFHGVLVLFLLEMGISAAERLPDIRAAGPKLIALGVVLPLAHGALGAAGGTLAGLSLGGATVLAALAASASYIAAPAAVRIALPDANPGYYLTAALAITFPFNLVIGIPLYYEFAAWMQ